MAVFIKLLQSERKEADLRQVVASDDEGIERRFVVPDLAAFNVLPSSSFVYWVSDAVRYLFSTLQTLDSSRALCRQGLATADDFRFVRVSWEHPPEASSWRTFSKGGPEHPFYADIAEVVNWARSGCEIKSNVGPSGAVRSNIWMLASTERDLFGRAGVTWSRRPHSRGRFVALPNGQIFSDNSPSVFKAPYIDLTVLALANSTPFLGMLQLLMPRGTDGSSQTLKYEVGYVNSVPIPEISEPVAQLLADSARTCWAMYRRLHERDEASHAFSVPSLLHADSTCLSSAVEAWARTVELTQAEIGVAESEIDALSAEAYGLCDDDLRTVIKGVAAVTPFAVADKCDLAAGLVSWCVGVGVGRFDVRLATGEREWPSEPDPFDPLPVCSPGMLTGEDGLPLDTPPEGYPVEVSAVLVDDPGHPLDITGRVRSVFETVLDDPDAWWADVGEALGAKRAEISSWLSKGFFDHHLKTYSKSRRKAPILWPLGTASGSYTVWLYAHRVTSDSLFRVLNDVVTPKLSVERRSLSELVQDAGPNPSTSQRKAMDGQEKLVGELEDLVGQLTAVAPLWHPDLNDGVVIVLAPLWRLFAHHKPWSKELRKHWDSLVAGAYDWAQLAMSLWPERVVPKCGEDRSLAIAHGLEDVFWAQDDDNPDKWHPRQTPTIPIDRLIEDRTDPATKAALEDTT